ncbi:hypothetical protein [Candidatus Nitrosocosmicus sp. T]
MIFPKRLFFVGLSSAIFALVYSSLFSSAFLIYAATQINCDRTGTMTVTCCQDHVINQGPSNPAGTLVTYCTDCEVAPGGPHEGVQPGYTNLNQLRNCGERYIDMKAEEPPRPSLPTVPGSLPEDGVLEQTEQPEQSTEPQDNQDDNQGGIPTIKNNENLPLDNEITEQSDTEDGIQETP